MSKGRNVFLDGLAAGLADSFLDTLFGAGRFLGDLRSFQVMTQGLIDLDRFFTTSFTDAFLVAVFRAGGFFFFIFDIFIV